VLKRQRGDNNNNIKKNKKRNVEGTYIFVLDESETLVCAPV
jgi:hypothetical protein